MKNDLLKTVVFLAICTACTVSIFFMSSCVDRQNERYYVAMRNCGQIGGSWIDGSGDDSNCVIPQKVFVKAP